MVLYRHRCYCNIGDDTTPYIGVKASEGIDTQKIFIESEGMHSMTLALTGTGFTNWESYVISETLFEVGKAGELIVPTPPPAETSIPAWIKNNAEWWADDLIDDSSFVTGLQWLITNGIMTIPPTEQGAGSDDVIPGWIKNNAEWWADELIPDSAFLQGIEFLITEEIMIIPSTKTTTTASSTQNIPAWIKNNAEWWADDLIDDGSFVSGIQYLIKVGIIIV